MMKSERISRSLPNQAAASCFSRIVGVACGMLLCPIHQVWAAPAAFPGMQEPVRIHFHNKPALTIMFRYCPKGDFEPGEPGPTLGATTPVDAFFLSETEVSQHEFKTIMGESVYEAIRDRAKLKRFDGEFGAGKNGHPIFTLSLTEAADFCIRLEQLANAARFSFKKYHFRLPSQLEWQFACRACADPRKAREKDKERIHFNRWIRVPVQPALWENEWPHVRDPQEPEFHGSQRQVIAVMTARQKDPKVANPLDILNIYLIPSIGCPLANDPSMISPDVRRPGQIAVDLLPVVETQPNDWELKGMHGNAAEWTLLDIARSADIRVSWDLLREYEQNGSKLSGLQAFLSGGSFNLLGADADWQYFTIWRGNARSFAQASDTDEGSSNRFEVVADAAGIRVRMEMAANDSWKTTVREAVLSNPAEQALPAHIAALAATVEELEESERETTRFQLSVYVALAHYKLGQSKVAAALLENSSAIPGQNAQYVGLLKELIARE